MRILDVLVTFNKVSIERLLIYPEYNICLNSLIEEPFGLSILEAMGSGLPYVCLDAKGNKCLVLNNENDFLFAQTTTPFTFSEAILTTRKEEKYQVFLGNSVRIARDFRIENMVDEIQKVYQS